VLRPDLNWGYVSKPQKTLNDREIPYARGKGLGGSSILNFGVYLYGSQEDYNRWADLVGDESWKWEQTKKSFQAIENYDFEAMSQYPHLAKPNLDDHGSDGPVRVRLPPSFEDGVENTMKAVLANGDKWNPDANSGDPTGISVFPSSYSKDGRTTSANAHLVNPPENLTVWTAATVHRLLFDGQKVIGIETENGQKGKLVRFIACGMLLTWLSKLDQGGHNIWRIYRYTQAAAAQRDWACKGAREARHPCCEGPARRRKTTERPHYGVHVCRDGH
jgi:choline dehydrogenase-like flavoprotein